MSPLGWHPPYLVDNTDTQYLGDQHWQQCWLFRFFSFLCPSVCLCVNQSVWLLVFTIHLRFLKIQNYWLAQLVYVRFEFMAWVKMHIKMFRNFPKKSGGRYWFQDLGQKRLFIYNQHLPILLDLCVVLCGSVKCSFSVYSVIFSSCQTVNNCIGNMSDFPEFLHLARNFLNQSNFHTQETSYIKHVPRHYRGTRHSRNQCFCLVMVNSGMPPTLSRRIKFQDPWNSNNSRKVLVAKLFFAYGYIPIRITYQCIFLLRLCLWIYIHRSHISI